MVGVYLQGPLHEQRYLITAGLRKAAEAGNPATLTADTIEDVISTVRPPRDLQEGVERVLRFIASRVSSYFGFATFTPETDYPLVVAKDAKQMNEYLIFAFQMDYLDTHKRQITLAGWRRLEELSQLSTQSTQAFVAMWFTPELTAVWTDGFQPGIEGSGYFKALRIDQKEHSNKIDDEIVAEIRRSGLVVADFTGNRGGVYFEAGLAQGLGIPVIWTCRKDSLGEVHFDTRQYNHIDWETPADLRARLDQRIRATLLPRRR